MKLKSKHIILTFVLFFTGLLLAVSFQLVQDGVFSQEEQDTAISLEEEIRSEILHEQETNIELQQEINSVRAQISDIEDDLGERERLLFNVIEDIDRLRMFSGTVPVSGPGISVSLADSDYVSGEGNPNHYIVHEYHIQKVVDELKVAGAEAVAINGQRLRHDSYIQCVGPVIEVDGEVSFAPFEITAIGDSDTLLEALQLPGGVHDQLLDENVQVRTEQIEDLMIRPGYEQEDVS